MISTVTTTTSAVTAADVMTYSVIAVIALIAFLAMKEVLTTEVGNNVRIQSFVQGSNVAIVPLLMVFVALVAYKVVTVV